MARADRLASGPAPCCGGCNCDCGGVPVFPVAPRATRVALLWKALLWFTIFLVGSIVGGTFGAVIQPCEAQQIQIDTSTAQYKANQKYVDSLVQGPFLTWVRHFRLSNWRLVVRADSLGMETALTYLNEPYKNAIIVFDVRRMKENNPVEVFVHELWHIKLAQYTLFVSNFFEGHDAGVLLGHLQQKEERLVTDLTRTLLWRNWN